MVYQRQGSKLGQVVIDNETQIDVMYVQGRAGNSSLLQHAARKDERVKMTALCYLGDFKARLDSCWKVSQGIDKGYSKLRQKIDDIYYSIYFTKKGHVLWHFAAVK